MPIALRHQMAKPLVEVMAAPYRPRDFVRRQEAISGANNVRIEDLFRAGDRIAAIVDFGNAGLLDSIASFDTGDGMAMESRYAGAPERVLVC